MKPTEIVEKYKYTIDLSLPLHILPKNQIKILVNDQLIMDFNIEKETMINKIEFSGHSLTKLEEPV